MPRSPDLDRLPPPSNVADQAVAADTEYHEDYRVAYLPASQHHMATG